MVKHGTKMLGLQVPDGSIRAFAKLGRLAVRSAEEKLAKVVRGYAREHVGSVPSETHLKAQVVFLSKAAEALSKMTGISDSDERTQDLGEKLGVAEEKMRQILKSAGASLPARAAASASCCSMSARPCVLHVSALPVRHARSCQRQRSPVRRSRNYQ